MKIRKVYYLSGTRAEYGLMRYSLLRIAKNFDLKLIVTGMHLKKEFGYTVREIEKDNFKILAKLDTLSDKDTATAMSEYFGKTILELTNVFANSKPDALLILGDRDEELAAAIVCAHLNIPIFHIHGGDQGDGGANIDDQIRHAITKFSHIHLAATLKSAQRIVKMGEEPWRVHVVGTPGLDEIIHKELLTKSELEKKYKLNFDKPYFLVIQHPILTQAQNAGAQIKITLEALKKLNIQTVLIYPNSDPGNKQMVRVIKDYENLAFLKSYITLPRKDYLSLLKNSTVLIGNSSSGTIDSSAYRIPVVNIGLRESTREHAANKIFVGHNKTEIIEAVNKALYDKIFKNLVKNCINPYGDGHATEKIISILSKDFDIQKLLVKKLTY